MRIAISGSTGLIGSTLRQRLEKAGHTVAPIVRGEADETSIGWDTDNHTIEADKLEGVDAVVHLAGENVGSGRWTEQRKRKIRDSRVYGTTTIAEAIAGLDRKPSVFLCSSAVGYYGSRGDEVLTETSGPGEGFLASVAQEWEQATTPAADAGVRTVLMRTGVVLSTEGGALKRMLLPFRLGIGGRVGSGEQYFPWIALDDIVGAMVFCIENENVSGAVNGVAPGVVTNREFTKTLGKVLNRPTIIPLPAFGIRLVMGQMGEELLLASARAQPTVLQDAGYDFAYTELEPALRAVLNKGDRSAA